MDKYDNKLNISDSYYENILSKIKKVDNIKKINNIIEKDLEDKIIDSLLDGKKEVLITP